MQLESTSIDNGNALSVKDLKWQKQCYRFCVSNVKSHFATLPTIFLFKRPPTDILSEANTNREMSGFAKCGKCTGVTDEELPL